MKALLSAFFLSLIHVGVRAQESATATSTAAAATHTVEVGKGGHFFIPDVVQVNAGDIVQFDFFPTNHSVVRAEYLYPCIPYEMMNPGKVGFFSGFQPVDAILNNPPKWSIRINDTEPIFFYCSAPDSCIEYQMVGVINPNATELLSTQKAFAANSSFMLNPGEDFPSESGPTTTTYSSTAKTTSSTPTSTSSSPPAPTATIVASTNEKSSSFPAGAIAGIVVGVVIIVALAAALFYFVGRHRSVKAQQIATGILDSKSGAGGQASPINPPSELVHGPGGMVYVPVQASEFHRISIPPVYGSSDPSQQRQSTPTTQSASGINPSVRTASPLEMYAPKA